MQYVLIILILLIILLLFLMRKPLNTQTEEQVQPEQMKICPLCQELLKPGQTVKSVVFAGKTDTIVHIEGCPHCRPPAENKRRCPVCKKILKAKDTVYARQFKSQNRVRIHVLGCSQCRKTRS